MSILIKGMKMPESCLNCPLETDYGTCGHFNGADYAKHPTEYSSRPAWCPLIELPPHGDLIDRDPFIDFIKTHWDSYDQWFVDQLEARPTIIPAEEGE